MTGAQSDLIVLVPDKDWERTMAALLSRHRSLGIRAVAAELHIHPDRDPGCREHGHEFLQPFCATYSHALLVFDLWGCGQEAVGASALEKQAADRLRAYGWGDRAAALVVDPELEAWVWSSSPHVECCLGWKGRSPGLRKWLADEQLLKGGRAKPDAPKEAMERALREVRLPRSSSIYEDLARRVSLRTCEDDAFKRFVSILRRWFPPTSGRPL
jgi:hypothetical protein